MRRYTWAIRWTNPYMTPPDGRPEVLLSVTRLVASSAETPPEIAAINTIGTGYSIHCRLADPPAPKRTMSEAAKRKLRRTKLRQRLQKKTPLYAQELYDEELRAKPDYYGTDAAEQ